MATKVLIWNAGNVTIGGHDIASSDPLSVSISPEAKILEGRILKCSAPTNSMSLSANEDDHSSRNVQFEYIDPRQGVVLSFLHSDPDQESVRVCGTIKGGAFGPDVRPYWIPLAASIGMMLLSVALMLLHMTNIVHSMFIYIPVFITQGLAMAAIAMREILLRRRLDAKLERVFQEDFDVTQITGQQEDSPDRLVRAGHASSSG